MAVLSPRRDRSQIHLVRRFAAGSFVVLLVVGALLHVLVSRQVRSQYRDAAEFHAIFVADVVIAPALRRSDLNAPITGERYRELETIARNQVLVGDVRRVKITLGDGTIAFSDEPSLVGRRFTTDAAQVRAALEGRRISRTADLSTDRNAFERGLAGGLVETYVPLRLGGPQPVAVAVLYQDLGPTSAAAMRSLRALEASLGVGLVLLYALLLPVAHRAGRLMRRQSERLELQASELRDSERRFRSLIQHASDVVTVVDADGVIRYLTPSVTSVLGYQPEELLERSLKDVLDPGCVPAFMAVLSRAAGGDETGEATIEARWRHRDGGWRDMEMLCTNLLADPSVRGIVLNSRDVTDRKELESELMRQAFEDSLTGLANRALFRDRLEHALARSRRAGTYLSLMFVDVDDFKAVNDGLGHAVGDQVLVELARRLEDSVRPGDTVARLGGDEFAVLLEDTEDSSDAARVAVRIGETLKRSFGVGDAEVSVRASIGIAAASETGEVEELLRQADVAMYAAKASRKGGYQIFDPEMHRVMLERLELKTDLRTAMEHGQLTLEYQPIVDMVSGEIRSVEALLRWRHPLRGVIGPAEFVPLAEETGLIVPVGAWVLRQACLDANSWVERFGQGAPSISVNVSARQLQDPGFLTDVDMALTHAGLASERLTVEVTESVTIGDTDAAVATLHDLKAIGVRIAMDDFGTGYSSLSYLRRLPLDIIKIDRSFVAEITSGPEASALAKAVIKIAQTLGATSVAEGVESAEQAEKLRALRCTLGQGYFYAPPMPAEAIGEHLMRGAVSVLTAATG